MKSNKNTIKEYEKRINNAKRVNGALNEVTELEETIKTLTKTIEEQKVAHLFEVSSLKTAKEQVFSLSNIFRWLIMNFDFAIIFSLQ